MQVRSLSAIFPPSGWEGARATSQAGSWVGATLAFSSSSSQENGDYTVRRGFPGSSVVKNLPTNAGDTRLIPGWGRSSGEGNGNPLQYSCLGNHMDRGDWQATVYGVARVGHDLVTKQQQ